MCHVHQPSNHCQLTCVAQRTVKAVPICAANPLVKVNLAIFSPMVAITLWPYVPNPATMPIPPHISTHTGAAPPRGICPVL
jgi:hypothetical protein